ncbi:MAG: CNNM domain-containing protein [Helicobacteraceae bacterium]|jgi:CBS domain containing-hemolysin-like protein|nr:CNNM domain-containing protein [Helicobacteraceae bacterium]
MTLLLVYLISALIVSFICSVLEAVLLSTTLSYIQSLSKTNPNAAAKLKSVKKDVDKSISAILTLNTFAHTIGAAGVGAEAQKLFGDKYMALTSIILTLLILYLSEIAPKTIGARYWKTLAPASAKVIAALITITYPFTLFATLISRLFGKEIAHSHKISRDEILAITELGEQSGAVREQEADLIENLMTLSADKVKDILTPRSVVFALQKDVRVGEAAKKPEIFIRSRIPVYDQSIDDVIGVAHSKKIMEEEILEHSDRKIEEIMLPIFRISENIPVLKALDLFIRRKEHLFLVVDNYGQTAGIVTLEDAIEQLLDVDIMDEYDQVEDMQEFAKLKMKSGLKTRNGASKPSDKN